MAMRRLTSAIRSSPPSSPFVARKETRTARTRSTMAATPWSRAAPCQGSECQIGMLSRGIESRIDGAASKSTWRKYRKNGTSSAAGRMWPDTSSGVPAFTWRKRA